MKKNKAKKHGKKPLFAPINVKRRMRRARPVSCRRRRNT